MADRNINEDKSRYIVSAVDSALDVLEIVSQHAGSSLADIAKLSGLNKSRTLRFLATLESHALVRKDDNGGFYLAVRAVVLGDRARNQMDQLSLLQPILDRVRDETLETIQFRVLDGLQTLCLAKSESPLDIRVHTDTGRPRELYLGSSKSILAFGGRELIDRVLSQPRASYTSNTLVDCEDLERQLDEVRKRGFSVSNSERIEGAVAIGAPIFNEDGTVTSCLSLLGPEFRMENKVQDLAKILLNAAKEASAMRLGS